LFSFTFFRHLLAFVNPGVNQGQLFINEAYGLPFSLHIFAHLVCVLVSHFVRCYCLPTAYHRLLGPYYRLPAPNYGLLGPNHREIGAASLPNL
jgi:hypothetical protein